MSRAIYTCTMLMLRTGSLGSVQTAHFGCRWLTLWQRVPLTPSKLPKTPCKTKRLVARMQTAPMLLSATQCRLLMQAAVRWHSVVLVSTQPWISVNFPLVKSITIVAKRKVSTSRTLVVTAVWFAITQCSSTLTNRVSDCLPLSSLGSTRCSWMYFPQWSVLKQATLTGIHLLTAPPQAQLAKT